ncbi:hypothetical protein ILUMI_16205, partial [Ignelater luminosus]
TPKDAKRTSNEKIKSYKLKDPQARAKYQKELEKLMDQALTEGSLNWEKYKETIKEVAKKVCEATKIKGDGAKGTEWKSGK